MKCFYHKDKKATVSCSQCGRFLCSDCAVELSSGVWCKSCIEAAIEKGEALKASAKEVKAVKEATQKSQSPPAGLFARIIAWGIDFVSVSLVSAIGYGVLAGFRESVFPQAFFAALIGLFIYDFIFTNFFSKTVGKVIMGIRVELDGKKPDALTCTLRSFVKIFTLVFLPAVFLSMGGGGILIALALIFLEVALIAVSHKAFHDYLAGTEVTR